ncbi:OLC1v1028950C1 [Oldenlandia corymbosa var. corymbosa]|uniref:OLC1v1028950C1 n=1 Tax=Oldenlandia corymbosa var. corymbosa TaxID=529605 RepID=A0AAV1CFL8_OLDCO|nr:OLC1v1028950C1 [Oldenlandia corymbosa var. corymbosa]
MAASSPSSTLIFSTLSPTPATAAAATAASCSSSSLSFTFSLGPFPKPQIHNGSNHHATKISALSIRAQTLDFSGSFFEGGLEGDDDPPISPGSGVTAVEDKEEPQCPPGLRQYETMAVLRPDMSEDERLNLTQRYEELLVAGGGMYVEVFNRGVVPLAYSIRKKNKAGETNTYLDGIYLLFTYFTKPESMEALETTMNADDDVIRSMNFKIKKRKY